MIFHIENISVAAYIKAENRKGDRNYAADHKPERQNPACPVLCRTVSAVSGNNRLCPSSWISEQQTAYSEFWESARGADLGSQVVLVILFAINEL